VLDISQSAQAPPGIKIPQQHQEPARGRGQMPGQLANLRLQPLQRHHSRPVTAGTGQNSAGTGLRLQSIEHAFDDNRRVRHFRLHGTGL